MKIKKIGHCCFVVEKYGVKILTDPGAFSSEQDELIGINAIFITHEHPDHLHIGSVKNILNNNPEAKIFTNQSIGNILKGEGIESEVFEDGKEFELGGMKVVFWDCEHAEICGDFGLVPSSAFFLDDTLYYAGDSFFFPDIKVKVLALPVEAPWMKISEAVDFAKKVKPEIAFPVHDGRLNPERAGSSYKVPEVMLEKEGIKFVTLKNGEEFEV